VFFAAIEVSSKIIVIDAVVPGWALLSFPINLARAGAGYGRGGTRNEDG